MVTYPTQSLRYDLITLSLPFFFLKCSKILVIILFTYNFHLIDSTNELIFLYQDIDIMWLRNPFPRLTLNQSVDLQISTDDFNGDEWSESNYINTGFYMIKSNNKTIQLFGMWYARRNNSNGLKEQDVLDGMQKDGVFRDLGVKARFLDSLYFSGFCKESKDFEVVTTVHATCCRSIHAKVADLTVVLHDWLRFKNSPTNETSTFQWSSHIACMHSW